MRKLSCLWLLLIGNALLLNAQTVTNIGLGDSAYKKFIYIVEKSNDELVCLYRIIGTKNSSYYVALYDKNNEEVWRNKFDIDKKGRFSKDEMLHLFVSEKSIYFLFRQFKGSKRGDILLRQFDFSGKIEKEDVPVFNLRYDNYSFDKYYVGQSNDKSKIAVFALDSAMKEYAVTLNCSVFNGDFSLFYKTKIKLPYTFGKGNVLIFDASAPEVTDNGDLIFTANLLMKSSRDDVTYHFSNSNSRLEEVKFDENISIKGKKFYIDNETRTLYSYSFYHVGTVGFSGLYIHALSLDSNKKIFDKTYPFDDRHIELMVGQKRYLKGQKPSHLSFDYTVKFKDGNLGVITCQRYSYSMGQKDLEEQIRTGRGPGGYDIISETSIIGTVIDSKGELVYNEIFFRNSYNKSPFYTNYNPRTDKINIVYAYTPKTGEYEHYADEIPEIDKEDLSQKLIFHEIGATKVSSKVINYNVNWPLNGCSISLSNGDFIIQKLLGSGTGLLHITY